MKRANYLVCMLFVISATAPAMEEENDSLVEHTKHPSCGQSLYTYFSDLALTGFITLNLGKKRFYAPLSQNDAFKLFAQKNIRVSKQINNLEQDKHIQQIAAKVGLNKLMIFAVKDGSDPIKQGACTGTSVTQFCNGTIEHAIGIPQALLDKIENRETRKKVTLGIIEREIARITQAYTVNDLRVQQLKISGAAFGYFLLSAAIAIYDPASAFATLPLGLSGTAFLANRYNFINEITCDLKAAELTESHENLLSTLKHGNKINQNQEECNIRIFSLMHWQEEQKKKV